MSNMSIRLPRAFKRGNTFLLPFQVTDGVGVPQDITVWTLESHLRDSNDTLLQNFTVTKTDPTNGWAEVSATAAQTTNWALGFHTMDIKVIDAASAVSSTMDIQVEVEEGPTHA